MSALARALTVFVALSLLLSACGGAKLAPVTVINAGSNQPDPLHTVRKGETVYAIAWRYGLDYRDIARWNALRAPYIIYPGQSLTLTGAGRSQRTAAVTTSREIPKQSSRASEPKPKPAAKVASPTTGITSKSAPKIVAKAPRASAGRLPETDPRIDNVKLGNWVWPVEGRLIGTFGKKGGKGINIEGRRSQPISAAHGGRVVYAGGGLIGYGELIIVKHNKRFLSAYAHNSAIFVKEGDLVTRGQRIAGMGSSGTDKVMLHFEIRRDGKPVNPLKYLPR